MLLVCHYETRLSPLDRRSRRRTSSCALRALDLRTAGGRSRPCGCFHGGLLRSSAPALAQGSARPITPQLRTLVRSASARPSSWSLYVGVCEQRGHTIFVELCRRGRRPHGRHHYLHATPEIERQQCFCCYSFSIGDARFGLWLGIIRVRVDGHRRLARCGWHAFGRSDCYDGRRPAGKLTNLSHGGFNS